MTDDDYARILDELDRLLNDPNVPMQPALIWRLVARYRRMVCRSAPSCRGPWPRVVIPAAMTDRQTDTPA